MAQTQLSQKYGSNDSIFDLKETKKTQKSVFPFGCKHFTTLDIGQIVPVDTIHLYPGDRIKLNMKYLLETFPLEVPTMTNFFVRTHWYFLKASAIWKGWNTFITKGRSGNISLEIPSVTDDDYLSESDGKQYSVPNSLGSYLGLPSVYYDSDQSHPQYLGSIDSSSSGKTETGFHLPSKFSVMDFLAYQKIVRSNFLAPNLLQDNKVWFPDDLEDAWRLDYGATNLHGNYFVPESSTYPESPSDSEVPTNLTNVVDIRKIRYAMLGDDYFTTAKPWLVRGNETSLDVELGTQEKIMARFYKDLGSQFLSDSSRDYYNGIATIPVSGEESDGFHTIFGTNDMVYHIDNPSYDYYPAIDYNGDTSSYYLGKFDTVRQDQSPKLRSLGVDLSGLSLHTNLSANTLRGLLAVSVWQERNTLTNGNYNRTIQVHWNHKPRSPEYEPMYLGGTTDVINFGEVIQTSSTVSGSPLGTKSGQGSVNSGADVLDFTADDYGIVMGVMFIVPETIYHGGIDRHWTELTFDEQMQPEFANLGYQPILKQELFCKGDDTWDKDLFGYQTRYAYLKQRKNHVSGLFELNSSQSSTFGPYVQAKRQLAVSNNALNQQFCSAYGLDRSFLSYKMLPAFKLQFGDDVRLIRSLPYQSTPETFGF